MAGIAYDEIGNPIKIENPDNYGNEIFMEWDGRELTQYYVSSIVPYNICTYTYNDEGIRTSKTVDGVTHYYYLSGSQIIAEEWNNILCLYLYDADGSPIGMQYRTTSMAEGSFYTYWFEKNLQGDIVAVYSDSGVKLRTYTYDAWGNVTETVLTQAGTYYYARYNPFRYRGYYYDTETGLYYLQSRYYNPEWGRFLNADGYVSTGTGLLGYNMFAYCNNNPVMFIDPSGDLLWVAALLLVGVLFLPSCQPVEYVDDVVEDTNDPNSLKGTPLDPGPKTTGYDSYEDAINAGIDFVYGKSQEVNWRNEVAVSVFQYHYDGKYYLQTLGDGIGTAHSSQAPIDIRNGTVYAIIHSHPNYQAEPFKQDWVTYCELGRKIQSFIVERYEGGRLVRYLDFNARDQDDWKIWP